MDMLLAFVTAAAVFCGYLALDQVRVDKKRRESMRLRIAPDGSTSSGNEYQDGTGQKVDTASPRAQGMLRLLRAMGVNVDETLEKLEQRFGQAGMPSINGPIYYLFFQRIVSLFLFALALMLILDDHEGSKLLDYVGGLFLMVGALFGPFLYLQNTIDKRRKKLQRAFPDTLDLLLIGVESGLALDAALNRVCNELGQAYPEMTAELNRTRLELALINDRVRALMNLGERTNMVAFRSLVAALIQSERFGTSLTDTLRVLSEDFRLLRLSEAEAKAARLPVLLTIPLIFCLLPVLVIVVLGPAIVTIARDGAEVTGRK